MLKGIVIRQRYIAAGLRGKGLLAPKIYTYSRRQSIAVQCSTTTMQQVQCKFLSTLLPAGCVTSRLLCPRDASLVVPPLSAVGAASHVGGVACIQAQKRMNMWTACIGKWLRPTRCYYTTLLHIMCITANYCLFIQAFTIIGGGRIGQAIADMGTGKDVSSSFRAAQPPAATPTACALVLYAYTLTSGQCLSQWVCPARPCI